MRVPTEEEIAAFTIDGTVFLVDLGNWDDLDGKELAAVVRWDGSIGLEYVRAVDRRTLLCGSRGGVYDVSPDEAHGCLILGRVIRRD